MGKINITANKNTKLIGEIMNNLFEETEQIFSIYNKTWDDIAWIGGDDFCISIEQFKEAAKDTNYDAGYGSEEVAVDLVVCFKDGSWLSRAEYDGSEWWKYNKYPQKLQMIFNGKIKLVNPNKAGWNGLKELNQ